MLAIWRAAVEQFEQGNDFVLATIVGVTGSSPRHLGTRFLVRKDGAIVGTIGGGQFEAKVEALAREALKDGMSRRVPFSFTGQDASSSDQLCGGNAEVLVEYVNARDQSFRDVVVRLSEISLQKGSAFFFTPMSIPPGGQGHVEHLLTDGSAWKLGGFSGEELAIRAMPESRLLKPAQLLEVPGLECPVFLERLRPTGPAYIFGAGHVGECVARLAAYVDFKVVILDDRAEYASTERVPEADEVVVLDSFENSFRDRAVDEDSFIVIVTRGHRHDKLVLEQALRTKAGYIGMMGSRRKVSLIREALLQEGFTLEDLERVHAPIGVRIGGETPQELAVSIVAEMIQVRRTTELLKKA
jgi:xanthine dehydrogenase accessory factor